MCTFEHTIIQLFSWNSLFFQEILQISVLDKGRAVCKLAYSAHIATRVFASILKRDIKKSIFEEQILFLSTYPDSHWTVSTQYSYSYCRNGDLNLMWEEFRRMREECLFLTEKLERSCIWHWLKPVYRSQKYLAEVNLGSKSAREFLDKFTQKHPPSYPVDRGFHECIL